MLRDLNQSFLIKKTNYSETFLSNMIIDSKKEKIIIKKVKNNPIQSFHQEIDALTNLKHENIVYILGFDKNKKEIYLEYLNGDNLSNYIGEKGRLSLDEAIPIFSTISKILDYIHSNSTKKPEFIHYDISDNNFIKINDSLKLLDFGTSYRTNKIPENYYKMEVGTLAFMSPEKLKFSPEYGKESDVYSFGVIAYKSLMGIEPFLECIGCIRKQILNHSPIPLQSKDPKIDELVMSCLEKNPKNRPKSYELIKFF